MVQTERTWTSESGELSANLLHFQAWSCCSRAQSIRFLMSEMKEIALLLLWKLQELMCRVPTPHKNSENANTLLCTVSTQWSCFALLLSITPSLFCLICLKQGLPNSLGWPWTCHPQVSASVITGICYHAQLLCAPLLMLFLLCSLYLMSLFSPWYVPIQLLH